jgi:hypothetical protein
MADTSLGFRYRGRMYGDSNNPTVQDLLFKDDETLTQGDMVNLEAGEVDLAAAADANLLGIAMETLIGVDSTTRIRCIVDADAIYGVYDPNARVKGACLEVSGATGAQTITASTNDQFVVYADSAADEETLLVFNIGKHHNNVAQT